MDIKDKTQLEVDVFKDECLKLWFCQDLAESYTKTGLFDCEIGGDGSVIWMKAQARQLWDFWRAAKAQAVPDGYVLVPKKEITDWYLDESEGMWLEELDHWACDLECGEVTVVDRLKVWPAADQFVAKVYIDEDNIELQLFDDEATAKRAAEYCKTMVLHDKQEAAEIFGAIVEAAENKENQ